MMARRDGCDGYSGGEGKVKRGKDDDEEGEQ